MPPRKAGERSRSRSRSNGRRRRRRRSPDSHSSPPRRRGGDAVAAGGEPASAELGAQRAAAPADHAADELKEGDFHESLSVAQTNALRIKLGLKPLTERQQRPPTHQEAAAAPSSGGTPAADPLADFKEGDFHEELSVAATDALRAKLGLRPLRVSGGAAEGAASAQRTAKNEIFAIDQVRKDVDLATRDLRLDPRVGIGKVRAQSQWDAEYLAKGQGTGHKPTENKRFPNDRGGSDTFVEPDFERGRWNEHLSVQATDTLRQRLGLRPLK
eukprot:TRINITY_DN14581_c0_g1_i1.p1 TRINITY_DN14581_c0_g1~~TRINITY_DN14581_c0_g1_i1.p1  ORF type:complete len:271 (+),score=64.15 TRINITY_DN14581_c0_g1_i1:72-884(+)